MSKQRQVQTDAFEVRSGSGQTYMVKEYTTQILQEFLDGSNTGWMDASKQYQVSGGGYANKIDATTFQIVSTGEEATRV
jgi:hypothetical protein